MNRRFRRGLLSANPEEIPEGTGRNAVSHLQALFAQLAAGERSQTPVDNRSTAIVDRAAPTFLFFLIGF